jgi:hypothetical protein
MEYSTLIEQLLIQWLETQGEKVIKKPPFLVYLSSQILQV